MMNQSISTDPKVTLVVVPRERFSYTIASLENIYATTKVPFKLIYVDGGSPTRIRDYLQEKAQEKNFELIRTEHYLVPNVARNMGLKRADTPYVVFVDNDVIVYQGWLKALLDCAETTNAAVVGPLMCQHEPVHEEIHFAAGEARIVTDVNGRRLLREKMYKQGHQTQKLRPSFTRTETELCEFHCMLARRDIFDKVGYFDEKMLNTKEHLDFCLLVRQQGETVYFEPDSLVTYVPGMTWDWSDIVYYMLRWSDAWELESLARLRQKWNLSESVYFQHKQKALGWRRRQTLLEPIINRLTFGIQHQFLHKLLMYGFFAPVEKVINRYLTAHYAQKWLNTTQETPYSMPSESLTSHS